LRELVDLALNIAQIKRITYADIRIISIKKESLGTKNGQVSHIHYSDDTGFGIRVLADGSWGFASSDNLTRNEVKKVVGQAIRMAKASSLFNARRTVLAPVEKVVTRWSTPFEIDPFEVPLGEKIDLLLYIDKVLGQVKDVKIARGNMEFQKKSQIFSSTDGSFIEQELLSSAAGYNATAISQNDFQIRSYPSSFGGQYMTKGYELIDQLGLEENAARIAEEAAALLKATQCPTGYKDIILDSSQLALQIHESCGHPAELDRVLGTEADFAGRSFLTLDKLHSFTYGSPMVNIVADSLAPGGMGTYGFDDEGVPAQRWYVVKEGLFCGYLTSRQTAPEIGLQNSQGAMRACGWNRVPLIRMNNVNLEPGQWDLEQLIADTKDGLYMETNRSWSIDQLRYNFQFGTEIGWEIKNGKKGKLVKNPTYQGITPRFWQACDAVCNDKYWVLWGVPNCGKGQPEQIIATSHGTAPARFRGIMVGVGYAK
jgi:TldD protein